MRSGRSAATRRRVAMTGDPRCDDDAAYRMCVEKACEIITHMREAGVDEDAARQIRAYVVADQAPTPRRHVDACDVIMPGDAKHVGGV